MSETDMATIAELVARALSGDPRGVAAEATALRRGYDTVHFIRDSPNPTGVQWP